MAPSHPSINSPLWSWLNSSSPPYIVRATADVILISDLWRKQEGKKWVALNGNNMRTWESAYAELSAAIPLPDYFGRNLDALSECLTDGDVIDCSGLAVWIDNASAVLADANADAIDGLMDTFTVAAKELAKPVKEGQPWDRPAIPFHVLLAKAEGQRLEQSRRWRRGYPRAGKGASQRHT